MRSKSILVTGGAGFIGANFLDFFLKKHTNYKVICVDALTYAANHHYEDQLKQFTHFSFEKLDIRDAKKVLQLFGDYQISDVIHFAAESHVDNSIAAPDDFITTNINGTFSLLKACSKHWLNDAQKMSSEHRFHHVSTDEVYGSLGNEGFFTENSPYAPNSPYSASKASSDFLVRSYHHTFNMNTVITNCSNNYGKYQHDEKLIPTIIRKAIQEDPIPIYGNGANVRDWLYVADHCSAIDVVFHKGVSGETYLVGGNNEQNNLNLAKTICGILDSKKPRKSNQKYEQLITFVEDRKGHDFRYAIDSSKLKEELNWQPEHTLNNALNMTIDWYLNKYQN